MPTQSKPTDERRPVVRFEYPDSITGKMRLRYLRVEEMNADHIKGTELDTPYSTKVGNFKTFSLSRIVTNGVSLWLY
jgi:hypothetical protein